MYWNMYLEKYSALETKTAVGTYIVIQKIKKLKQMFKILWFFNK